MSPAPSTEARCSLKTWDPNDRAPKATVRGAWEISHGPERIRQLFGGGAEGSILSRLSTLRGPNFVADYSTQGVEQISS
jgi:hypothetical protein